MRKLIVVVLLLLAGAAHAQTATPPADVATFTKWKLIAAQPATGDKGQQLWGIRFSGSAPGDTLKLYFDASGSASTWRAQIGGRTWVSAGLGVFEVTQRVNIAYDVWRQQNDALETLDILRILDERWKQSK